MTGSPATRSVAPDEDEYGDPVAPIGSGKPPLEPEEPAPEASKPTKKKKRDRSAAPPESSRLKRIAYGFVGGSIGGAVWIAVAYFTQYEMAIIACLVGIFTGLGVQTAMTRQEESGAAETAAATAIVVVALSKYAVVCLLNGSIAGVPFLDIFTPFDLIWFLVAGVAAYQLASGASD